MKAHPSSLSDAPIRLSTLRHGDTGIIDRLECPPEVQLRLLELGVAPGERVTLRYIAPLGGPLAIELMNYRLAIRRSEAAQIWVHRAPAVPA